MSLIILPKQIRQMRVRTLEQPPTLRVEVEPHEMHWQVLDAQGRVVREAEQPIHNLVLNQVYTSLLPTHGIIALNRYAAVGLGAVAPSPTDTILASETARTGTVPSGETDSAIYVSPGVYDIRRVKEFTEAQVGNKNLTEWGFSPSATAGGLLMCRELFRDGSNNPITLTLAADQKLRLIYKMRVTIGPTTVQNVTVNIGGEGPGPRTAKFIVTTRFGHWFASNNTLVGGITFLANGRFGDLLASDAFIKGSNTDGNLRIAASSATAPLVYDHSTSTITILGSGSGSLAFAAPASRFRTASFLADTGVMNGTIKSVILSTNIDSTTFCPTINLVFDAGQEFTKANTHRLLIANYRINW